MYSELSYMDEFILEADLNGEIGYILVTFHTALQVFFFFFVLFVLFLFLCSFLLKGLSYLFL